MRTGRSLTVCRSLLPGGGGLFPGGVCSRGGVSALGGLLPGGVCSGGCLLRGVSGPRGCLLPGGVSSRGGCLLPGGCLLRGTVCSGGVCSGRGCLLWGVYPSMHWGRHPPLWTESQTPVKTLPWPNFVAAGNYYSWYNLK